MDNPKSPPPSTTATATPSTNKHALENFKSLVMKCAIAASTPTDSLTSPQKTLIEKRIQEFLPAINHTPDHPSYAWMIERAIKELDEEGGSTEEAISKFIIKEYNKDQLPWAHSAFLKHHLIKLCESGNLLVTTNHDDQVCYLIGETSISIANKPTQSPSTTYDASTSSSSDDPSFTLNNNATKGRRRKNKTKATKSRNARGIIIHPKCKKGRRRRI